MFNSLLNDIEDPPIDEVQGWVRGRTFPDEKPLIDLSQALPSYPPASELRIHMSKLVLDESTSGYTEIGGIPQLREAYAEEVSRFYQTHVQDFEVFITAGCNQAFFLSMLTLGKFGDEVILPAPYYFNHKMTLEMLGMTPVILPCRPENDMLPDVEQAETLITPKSKAIILVSPNNPTGRIYPQRLIEEFFELAQKNGLLLVLDETYRDFLNLEHGLPHHLLNFSWQENFIQLYSFSKVYALAGYRVGAITASTDFLKQLVKVMDCAAICAPKLAQNSAFFALKNLDSWRQEKRKLMNLRADTFNRLFEKENDSSFRLNSLGPCFGYISHTDTQSNLHSVAKELAEKENLLVLPGSMFGPEQESFLRVAFANVEMDTFSEIMNRLNHFTLES